MTRECETCGGEGTVIEFRRFAGEYQAGEPVEVCCPDCDGAGEFEDDEETTSVLTLDDLREVYGNPFGTVCAPDPLKHIEPKDLAA